MPISKEMFVREIVKLQEQFGDKKFSQRKSELIYNAVNRLNLEELCAIVDNFIGNAKFAPHLEDFVSAASKYSSNRDEDTAVKCSTCDSMGIVVCRKKTGQIGEYAFQCTCENGTKFGAMPKWHSSLQKTFTKHMTPIALTNEFYGHKTKDKK